MAFFHDIYDLQRSCEGYVFTPVCHSVHGGLLLSACWDTTPPGPGTPLGPGTPWSRHPQDQAPPWNKSPQDQTPPQDQAPPQEQAPLEQTPLLDQALPLPADGYC